MSTVVRLPTQAWVPRGHTGPPTEQAFRPATGHRHRKPGEGGLWTSTWFPDVGSDWITEAGPEGMGLLNLPCHVYLLEPVPAKVLRIDDLGDLTAALDVYGKQLYPELRDRTLDYERLARDFDAVHVTQEGQWRTRLSHPDDLYGWDCESTLWLAWCFATVAPYGQFMPVAAAVS